MAQDATREARAAETLLQAPLRLRVAGREFVAPPPTVATLMRLSEEVAALPRLGAGWAVGPGGAAEGEQMLQRVIANASGCGAVGRAVAVLLLGARGYARRRWWRAAPEGERLAEWLLGHAGPRELFNAFARLVQQMQVADFFAFTAFLHEANMMRGRAATRTTAPGR